MPHDTMETRKIWSRSHQFWWRSAPYLTERTNLYSRFGRNLLKFANFNGIIQRIWLTMRGGGGERQGFWSNLSNWVSFNKNNYLTCQYLTFLTHTYCPLPHYSNRSSFDLGGSGLDKFLRSKSLIGNTLVFFLIWQHSSFNLAKFH